MIMIFNLSTLGQDCLASHILEKCVGAIFVFCSSCKIGFYASVSPKIVAGIRTLLDEFCSSEVRCNAVTPNN